MRNMLGCYMDPQQGEIAPFQGPITYTAHIQLGYGGEGYRELHYLLSQAVSGEIEIEHEDIDSEGYNEVGKYFGVGEPLFNVFFDGEMEDKQPLRLFYYPVRSPSLAHLQDHLQHMYPHITLL